VHFRAASRSGSPTEAFMDTIELILRALAETVSLKQAGVAFSIILGALIVRRVIHWTFERLARQVTSRSRTDLDDLLVEALSRPVGWSAIVVGFYLALNALRPPALIVVAGQKLLALGVSLLLTWLMIRLVNVGTEVLQRWASRTDSVLDDQLVPLVAKASKVTVGLLATLLVLQNLGYSISGLIAGLGVGGLAVALAAQKTLSDVFGSVMLLVDRPFTVGDWIRSPDGHVEGVVEEIGFRSTKIRTFEKTLVYVPNSRLADFIIDNIDRRPIRRVWITVGVTYQTTGARMREAVGQIRSMLSNHEGVDQGFYLVRFTDFGSSSLDIMVYYFANTTVWDDYLAVREDVNLRIMGILENLKMEIAFPTRTVHLESNLETNTASNAPNMDTDSSGQRV
jgi:MscS family membrane protein